MKNLPKIPKAPRSIKKGSSLKDLLSKPALQCLANNLSLVDPKFKPQAFIESASSGLGPLGILERGHHISRALKEHLPEPYAKATEILIRSLTPPLEKTHDLGLHGFFYLPHVCFVANYGLDPKFNSGRDPFAVSMQAQHELTRRFSAEFSIRPFLIQWPDRTLKQLKKWTKDPSPHVRRLCSEGTRPRLPWAMQLPQFIKDPNPVLPLLETLKDDPDLYVRRSVANHLGDIAKDHLDLALSLCQQWLKNASSERKWLIRHALRYPAKKGESEAIRIRKLAK